MAARALQAHRLVTPNTILGLASPPRPSTMDLPQPIDGSLAALVVGMAQENPRRGYLRPSHPQAPPDPAGAAA
jgi:hypothetical protein